MKQEIRIFFTAMMFYTRFPCPSWVDHAEEYLNKSSRYFPLIGIIVGSISAFSFYAFQFILPVEIALLLSMVTSILSTGAFHEDGFADVCDGFGGGWTKEKILMIMKDSRVGTYGLAGLCLLLLLKWTSLKAMPVNLTIISLISAHAISRFTAASLIFTDEYSREDETSKVKPLAKKMSLKELLMAAFFGLAPLLLFQNAAILLAIIPLICMRYYLSGYFKKWIDGYTGDCLGTVQQVSEVLFYLSVLVILR